MLLQDCQGFSNFEIIHLIHRMRGWRRSVLLGNWVQIMQEEVVMKACRTNM